MIRPTYDVIDRLYKTTIYNNNDIQNLTYHQTTYYIMRNVGIDPQKNQSPDDKRHGTEDHGNGPIML